MDYLAPAFAEQDEQPRPHRAVSHPPNWRGPGGVAAEPPDHISRPVSRVL